MNGATILLDVSIPMYAAGQDHPYKQACVWVMTEIAERRIDAAIDAETVQEILYRYGALRQWNVAVALATSLLDIVPIVFAVTPADARRAVDLFARYAPLGVTARDLLHAAVMLNNGLTTTISTDQHFDRLEGVRRLDPLDIYPAARKRRP